MSDYTPTTADMQEWYVRRDRTGRSGRKEYEAEFNRWLARERAQARAEALKEAADVFDRATFNFAIASSYPTDLRNLADKLKRK